MISLNIPIVIVAAFLLLTLVGGAFFSKKKTNFREYTIRNKDFSTATLVATVLATLFGGGSGLIRNIEATHELGLVWILFLFIDTSGFWILSKLATRMGPFMQHFSIAETIGSVYGKYPRIITGLVAVCSGIVVMTIQVTIMSRVVGMCLGSINLHTPTMLATLLLIFYSSFGGIRAVTITDVLQFITFSIVIPLLSWVVFLKVGKPIVEIVPILQRYTKFQFSNVFRFNTQLINILLLYLSLIIWSIHPGLIQRLYMASGSIQAQKVFSYAIFFRLIIMFFIVLVGIFSFVGAPDLPKEAVWEYVITHIPPVFKGFVAASLLAMAMSTADAFLNTCSVMVSHDIVKSLQNKKEVTDAYQLKIARQTTLVVGLLAMLLAFHCRDLLRLMYWSLSILIPITAAPFILAIYGFRGTSRTVFAGMATGCLTICVWNQRVKPLIKIDGSFIAMVANGLAMMVAHYLLKQPESAGWVGPDDVFKQVQQENARKRSEYKNAINNAWLNRKAILVKLVPNHITMVYVGLYITITGLLAYFITNITHRALILELFGAACCLGYPFFYDISKKIRAIPNWFIGLCWLMGLALYLPIVLNWHWWHLVNPVFTISLSLAHCAVILSLLPLYLAIGVVATTLLVAIYPIATAMYVPLLSALFPLFVVSLLLIFAIIISFKVKQGRYKAKILYLEDQVKIRESQQLKASLYEAALLPSNAATSPNPRGYGVILNQVVGKIEESISFLDKNLPLYKEDFQSIINKLYDWVAYFNRRVKAKKHALLRPAKITLDKLIRKVELALAQEVTDPPRLLVEKISDPNGTLSSYIICDINQVVYLLVKVVLRIGTLEGSSIPIVRMQLHPTALQFTESNPINNSHPTFMLFQATAFVISQASIASEDLPKVKDLYHDKISTMAPQQKAPPLIDLQQETIFSIVAAHYGYLESHVKQSTMLLVLPNDVIDMLNKMAANLPIDCLISETFVPPKEQADSMMALMQFHDYVSTSSSPEHPIDIDTISGLLLLLRQHFGFRRHASGQLFYVRAVGIAKLVVEWVFHSPKVIYAALLYELVRHTCLPLSYVKEHYNLGVHAFVSNMLNIDNHQALDHPSLLYVQNRLKEAIMEDHVQLSVLFIKLAERLYDLRHASAYVHLTKVQHMAQETLAIDVKLANAYLDPEIGTALEQAAKQALELRKSKGKAQCKKGDKDK